MSTLPSGHGAESTPAPCPPGHLSYLSSYLAGNATVLHTLAYPACQGFGSWRCGDHWHVGHTSPAVGDRCKADHAAADLSRRGRHDRRPR